jgi:hypothetical protein
MTDLPGNPEASQNEGIVHFIDGCLSDCLIAVAEARAPFLNAPVIKQLFEGFVNHYWGKADRQFQIVAADATIDHQTGEQTDAVHAAWDALQEAKKSGDPQKIREAFKAYADATSAAGHYAGVDPPK